MLGLLGCFVLQTTKSQAQTNPVEFNTITTAVPFLTITPDGRHGALGDAGVGTLADGSDTHWNPARLVRAQEKSGFSLSYTPWLRELVSDIDMTYLSYYNKLSKKSAVGGSFRYFSLGYIQFTDDQGNSTIQFRPNEFAFDGSFSTLLSRRWSGGVSLRFIYSNLSGGQNVAGAETKPGIAVAADVFGYYESDEFSMFDQDATLGFGAGISNIGNKMAYSNLDEQDFLPTTFKIGPSINWQLDDYNRVSFNFDVNKLLVPTPPIYDNDGNIIAGRDPDRSPASALVTSWYDAPGQPVEDEQGNYTYNEDGTVQVEGGSVFREEMREFFLGFGLEYMYSNVFAARMGYFTEHASKGNRKHMTFGVGLKFNRFGMDMSYLVPMYIGNQTAPQNSPLQNTLRFTLTFDFKDVAAEEPTN